MTIVVEIDGMKRNWSDTTPNWIAQQINRRRRDGRDVCVRIHVPQLNAAWSTANCPTGKGAPPSGKLVQKISEIYSDFDIDEEGYPPGQVIAFIKRIERLL